MAEENWNRQVWRLAGPIILANMSLPILGAVDTAVVGHLPGPQYIGGVSVGAIIFNFIYYGFNFLRMGTTGFTAQAYGARDGDEVRASLARALIVAAALGAILILFQWPIAEAALGLIGASDAVEPLARGYFDIRIWGAPATLANFAILGWFIGIHNTRAALILQVFMNGLNIVLDLWFVLGLGWGVEGVAAATLISEVSAGVLGLWLVARNVGMIKGRWRLDLTLERTPLRRMLGINRDILIRSMCLQTAFVLFTMVGARLGDDILAANAVLLVFQFMLSYGLDGFAHAVEALAGGAIGSGSRERFRGAVKASTIWAVIVAGAYVLVYGLGGTLLIDLITNIEDVRAGARAYLPWAVLSPIVSVWSFQLDGIYIGATRGREMRNSMAAALVFYVLALAVLAPVLANHGVWLAFMVLMVVRAVTLGRGYRELERSIGSP